MSRAKIPLVDLKAQYMGIRDEVSDAIARVLAETSFILGPEVDAFEREFAKFCEAEHCVGCANGTEALSLALEAVGVCRGDEVITVAHTFIATAEAISSIGARPVFVDVSNDTLLMDVSKIRQALTARTKAIVPVHLYGQVVDMDPLLRVAKEFNLKVVEDAAQAHGARYKGRCAGTLGDAAAFSFYPGKNLGSYGDAGAIVTNDGLSAAWIRMARNHGRANKYEHDFEGRNSRMDGLQAAVLRVKLKRLQGWNLRRRELADMYDNGLPKSIAPLAISEHNESARHLYVVRVPDRDRVLQALHADSIEAGIHYPLPLHRQKAYAHLNIEEGALPVTERACQEILSLPLYPEMDASDISAVIRSIGKAMQTPVR